MKKILSKIKLRKPGVPELKMPDFKIPNIPGVSPALGLGEALFSKVIATLDGGVGLLKSTLGGIPFLGRTATSKSFDHTKYDERHYFLVPEPENPEKYSLCITRCLPNGVPPVNDLPKRRLLHLPSKDCLPQLEAVVLEEASDTIKDTPREPGYLASNLGALLDEIDKVDEKAFKGLLLVGGLVALVNPLAGAAVAAKAALPAVAMVLSKYGLKMATDTANNIDIARQIKKTKKEMKKQFGQSSTHLVINPLLANLGEETSLEAWLMEKEKYHFICDGFEFSQADLIRLMDLTRDAIQDSCETPIDETYFKTLRDRVLWND